MGTRHYNSPTTAWELIDQNIKPLLLHNRVNSDYANGMIGDILFLLFPLRCKKHQRAGNGMR